jgi:hypothetical protein
MLILDDMERRDAAYRSAYGTWCCPNNCGSELSEYENGRWCPSCQQPFTWAELAAADCDD